MPHVNYPFTSFSRRKFLALTGAVPAALLAQSLPVRASAAEAGAQPAGPVAPRTTKPLPIGLELYSVREALKQNLPGTLATVAKLGYEVVEFYSPYFGWTLPYAKEVRSRMDDLGLRCYSTHNHIESFTPGAGMAKAIELNQILGTRQLILASTPKGTDRLADWEALCAHLSAAVQQLLPHGLAAGFHNHQTEWAKIDGDRRIMDVIAASTPAEFVLQFDVGTCLEAGADPLAWVKAHPGRIKSVHLKDWAPGKAEDNKGYRVLFGEGVAPWAELTAALESGGGVEFYLLEQEGSRFSEFETAQRCLENWRAFRKPA